MYIDIEYKECIYRDNNVIYKVLCPNYLLFQALPFIPLWMKAARQASGQFFLLEEAHFSLIHHHSISVPLLDERFG